MESDKEPQDLYSKQFSPHDNISMQEQPYSSVKHKETIKPTYIAGKNKDFEGRLNDGSLLTNVVLDEWIKDLDTATNHIAKSARNIVDCLEQVRLNVFGKVSPLRNDIAYKYKGRMEPSHLRLNKFRNE